MTEDQLNHANDIFHAMKEHQHKAKSAQAFVSDDSHYCNSIATRFPKEIIAMNTQQVRDWHKLRAYELAEEFAKL